MKTNVITSVVDPSLLEELTSFTKETVAKGVYVQPETKNRRRFGSIDLWKIRRGARMATLRVKY